MHWRRFAAFLLGAWLAGLFFLAYMASENVKSADRLMDKPLPRAAEILEPLGDEQSRHVLRHMASEQNRYYLSRFEVIEVCIGIALTAVIFLGTHANRLAAVLSALMVAITLFLHFALTPEISYLGQQLDFVADNALPEERSRLLSLEVTYTVVAAIKVLMGAALTWYLLTLKSRFRRAHRSEVKPVYNPDHGHVNG